MAKTIIRERQLWIISIPLLIWVLIFSYMPMYGVLASFFDYIPGKSLMQCTWVGFRWFHEFFNSPDFKNIMRNTLVISGLGIVIGFPAPIILALLLNELGNRYFKKTVQTLSYLPNFISWVVAASIFYSFLGNDGIINDLLIKTGLTQNPISFLGDGKYFWGVITFANIWKSVGWSSIMYLSAIAGVDSELFQAGAVDGLGRFGMIWHIILPGIRPTIILLWIIALSGVLNAGFEQQLLIGNAQTREFWDVIDTYAYRYGALMGRYSYSTAVGFLKSVIGLGLLLASNRISKTLFDLSII
jgi:ABC-type polysaccharide transport system, permease component